LTLSALSVADNAAADDRDPRTEFLTYLAETVKIPHLVTLEYRRLRMLRNFDPEGRTSLHIGLTLLEAGETSPAAEMLAASARRAPDETTHVIELALASAYLRLGEHEKAWQLLSQVALFAHNPAVRRRARLLNCLTLVQMAKGEKAENCLDSAGVLARLPPEDARDIRARLGSLGSRSASGPWLVGISSAVLPGAGQTLSGYPAEGAKALGVNAAGLASTGYLALQGLYLESGLILAGFWLRYYIGNIQKSVRLYREKQRIRDREAAAELLRLLGPLLDQADGFH